MTDKDYSQTAFLKFLREGAITGITSPATARSRKLAAEHLLIQLKSHERIDLRLLDVDELCTRFHKLQDSSIRPESLKLYNTRLKSALLDYFAWIDDPEGFVTVGAENRSLRKRQDADKQIRSAENKALEEIKLGAPEKPGEILPVPIRLGTRTEDSSWRSCI